MDTKTKFPKFSLNFGRFFDKIRDFQWFLISFGILGCIMTKWIPRLNFPNFPLILEDFCTKLKISKFSDIFWPFGLYNELMDIKNKFPKFFLNFVGFSYKI